MVLMILGGLLFAGFSSPISSPAGSIPDDPATWSGWIMPLLGLTSLTLIILLNWYRIPDGSPDYPQRCDPLMLLMLYLMMFVTGILGVTAAKYLGGVSVSADTPLTVRGSAILSLGLYAAQLILLAVTMNRWGREGNLRRAIRGLGTGIITIAMIVPIILAVGWLAGEVYGWWRGEPPEIIAHDTLELMLRSQRDLWFWVLAAGVIFGAAICEEAAYREFLQGALRGWGLGSWFSIGITSIIFALVHWDAVSPHALFALFTLALGLGWAREKTGTLVAPIIMHMLFNAGNLGLALLITS